MKPVTLLMKSWVDRMSMSNHLNFIEASLLIAMHPHIKNKQGFLCFGFFLPSYKSFPVILTCQYLVVDCNIKKWRRKDVSVCFR